MFVTTVKSRQLQPQPKHKPNWKNTKIQVKCFCISIKYAIHCKINFAVWRHLQKEKKNRSINDAKRYAKIKIALRVCVNMGDNKRNKKNSIENANVTVHFYCVVSTQQQHKKTSLFLLLLHFLTSYNKTSLISRVRLTV